MRRLMLLWSAMRKTTKASPSSPSRSKLLPMMALLLTLGGSAIAEDAAVDAAVDRGLSALVKQQRPDGLIGEGAGISALAGLALLAVLAVPAHEHVPVPRQQHRVVHAARHRHNTHCLIISAAPCLPCLPCLPRRPQRHSSQPEPIARVSQAQLAEGAQPATPGDAPLAQRHHVLLPTAHPHHAAIRSTHYLGRALPGDPVAKAKLTLVVVAPREESPTLRDGRRERVSG